MQTLVQDESPEIRRTAAESLGKIGDPASINSILSLLDDPEPTETALMHEADNALTVLQRFNDMGVNIAVDDFGIGYSSLSYLRRLPVNALKIDQSFVKGILTTGRTAQLCVLPYLWPKISTGK